MLRSSVSATELNGANLLPGPIKEGDSHRPEMAGLYAIVLLLCTLCSFHRILSGKVLITCDNKHALRVLKPGYIPDPKEPNFDLVTATWMILKELLIVVTGEHVKGHQDDHLMYFQLNRFGRLNVDMDKRAKQYWQEIALHDRHSGIPQPASSPIFQEGWQLWQGNTKITQPCLLYTSPSPRDS